MSNAPLDENSREGIICALNTDGVTIVGVRANPITHAMKVANGLGQADNGNHDGNALIDENSRSSWYGLSSAGNGERIIIYANSLGAVLTQKT